MITATTTRRRGGFTLIELMVVVALIAILAALSVGTFFRIQANENQRATESVLNKLHSHLDIRWKAQLDDARKTVPEPVVALAAGDQDRALALWTYAKLQSEFPESFAEVWITTPPGPRAIVLNGYPLPPKNVFTDIAKKTYTPAPTTDEQAAALFYAAINQTGGSGVTPAADGLNQQTKTTPSGLTYYVDAWGQPITFKRWAKLPELQSGPLLRPNQVRRSNAAITNGQPATFAVNNPLDPTGKLITWPTYGAGLTDNPWAEPTHAQYRKNLCLIPTVGTNALGINAPLNASGQADFTNENFLPTLISYGPNKKAGILLGGDDDGNDNILSFRQRRQGTKGD